MEWFQKPRLALLAVLLCTLTRGAVGEDTTPKARLHRWQYIHYAPLKMSPPRSGMLLLSLSAQPEAPWMTFQVTSGSDVPVKQEAMTVRLHRGSEPPLAIVSGGSGAIGGMGAMNAFEMFHFPWSSNVLAEAWIELRFPAQTYWLEIPYGFTGNPADASLPAPDLDLPRLAPAMNRLGTNDHILPWLNVHYDAGEIQNGWRLSVRQANRVYPETEVILYRDDGGMDKSVQRWEMCSPQTSVKVIEADGTLTGAYCVSIRRHEDGLRRSDTFMSHGNDAKGRAWGRLLVTVDDRTHELLLPSSMFRHRHGVAEPGHARRQWPEGP